MADGGKLYTKIKCVSHVLFNCVTLPEEDRDFFFVLVDVSANQFEMLLLLFVLDPLAWPVSDPN
jgi:hypothetical protein